MRVLPNGDITLFDNGANPQASRGVEYQLDQVNKTATKVWQYASNPAVWAQYMGDIQRLPNDNNFLDWGSLSSEKGYASYTTTEVDPNNNPVWQLAFENPYVSYRATRSNWMGFPDSRPDLAFQQNGSNLTLGYSWNGATEVGSWLLLAGSSPNGLQQVDQQNKTGFETQSQITNVPANQCYYQVIPVDKSGVQMTPSAIITTNPAQCPPVQ